MLLRSIDHNNKTVQIKIVITHILISPTHRHLRAVLVLGVMGTLGPEAGVLTPFIDEVIDDRADRYLVGIGTSIFPSNTHQWHVAGSIWGYGSLS